MPYRVDFDAREAAGAGSAGAVAGAIVRGLFSGWWREECERDGKGFMVKAVLFDMDGVLVDTEWFYNRRRVAYLKTQGFTFNEIPDLSGSNEQAIWEYFVPDDAERRARLRTGYGEYQKAHPVPYAELLNRDAKPVMQELRRRGIKLAIASSGYATLIDELVRIASLEGLLDYTLSGHDCAAFKPEPEVYLRTMGALEVRPSECLVVEDSPIGIEAGLRAGARVLALHPHEGVALDQRAAHRVIDSLWDIVDELG